MRIFYNRIAGQSLERLAALSDGIFAVAMTLLVLDLHTPVADAGARFSTPLLLTSQGLAKELALLGAFSPSAFSGSASKRSSTISRQAIATSRGFISSSCLGSPSSPVGDMRSAQD